MGAFLMKNPKCVFIHIPKTAGFSIRNGVFEGNYEGPVFEKLPDNWREYYKFSFVRNPYDRLVSAWKMFSSGMQKTRWSYNNEPPLKEISFLDFLEIAIDDDIDHHTRDNIQSVLRHHVLPQVHPYHCLQFSDFIGRFESLEEDFRKIAAKVGLKNYNLKHLNKTTRDHYKEYYDEKSYELVSNYYKEDISRFNYEF